MRHPYHDWNEYFAPWRDDEKDDGKTGSVRVDLKSVHEPLGCFAVSDDGNINVESELCGWNLQKLLSETIEDSSNTEPVDIKSKVNSNLRSSNEKLDQAGNVRWWDLSLVAIERVQRIGTGLPIKPGSHSDTMKGNEGLAYSTGLAGTIPTKSWTPLYRPSQNKAAPLMEREHENSDGVESPLPPNRDKQVNPLSRLTIWLKITAQGAEVSALQSTAGSSTDVYNDPRTTPHYPTVPFNHSTDSFNRTKTSNMNSHNVNITNNNYHSCPGWKKSQSRKSRWSITTFVHHVVHHIVPPIPWFPSWRHNGSFSSWIPNYQNWWAHHTWPWSGWHC